MNNKLLTIGVLLAIVAGVWGISKPATHETVHEVTHEVSNPTPGALTGPDIPSPYLSVAGNRKWYGAISANTASTTSCVLQSPAATSTVIRSTMKLTTSTSTALVFTVGKARYASTTSYIATSAASSTAFASSTVAANATGDMVYASSTLAGLVFAAGNPNVFSPNDFLTWTVTGGGSINLDTGTGNRIGGALCTVEFQEL